MTLKVHILAEKWLMREANGIATAVSQLQTMLEAEPGFELIGSPSAADVIHCHTVGARYTLLSLRHRRKFVVSTHVLPGSCIGLRIERLCRLFTTPYLRMAYNRARRVISLGDKEQLLALGVRADIVVLPNTVDRARFEAGRQWRESERRRRGIAEDDFVVLGVGQFQPRKGVLTFARVAEMLPQFRFIWVGGSPFGQVMADQKKLNDLQANPPANLTFTGIVPWLEMPRYYGLADAFLFPSYQEVCPLSVLEASAAGLPLVLRDNPEYEAVFAHHYIAAVDDAGFVEALRRLSKDAAYDAQWREEAEQMAGKYDLHANKERLLAIYRSVAGR